jgi:hypothetical protein
VINTRAPAAAKKRAVALPIPEPPPVMTTTLSCNDLMIDHLPREAFRI